MGQFQSAFLSMASNITSLAQLKTQKSILEQTKLTDAEKKAKNYATAANKTLEHDDLTTEEQNFIAQGDVKAAEGALEDNPTYENVKRRREAKEFAETTQELHNEELEMDRRAAQAAENAKIAKQEELRQQREGWLSGTPDRSVVIKGKGGENE